MLGSVIWDDSLVQRYGQARQPQCGYPAADDFNERIAPLDLLRALRESRKARRPLSIAIHLPANAALQHDDLTTYLGQLQREIEQLSCHVGPAQQVEQLWLHVGALGITELRSLVALLESRFRFAEPAVASFTAEVELAHADWSLVGALHELGFDHLSVSVPDLGADEGGTVEWFRSSTRIRAVVEAAHTLHYRSVNVDLGYGRAWQTPATFARKLAAIIELAPDRVSLFDYRDSLQAAQGNARLGLASPADTLAMHRHGIEQLGAAGYRHIGLGRFVLPHDDLAMAQETGTLNHGVMGYTPHGDCDHLGLGVGAISRVGELFSRNLVDARAYQQALDRGLLPSDRGVRPASIDRLRLALFDSLLCEFQLDFAALAARTGVDVRQRYAQHWPALQQLHRDGLVLLEEDRLEILPRGCLLLAPICAIFNLPTDAVADAASGRGVPRRRTALDGGSHSLRRGARGPQNSYGVDW